MDNSNFPNCQATTGGFTTAATSKFSEQTYALTNATKNDIRQLEHLTRLCSDSINGYRECAELVREEDRDLSQYFVECANQRTQLRDQLRRCLQSADASNDALRDQDGTVTGTLHQYFVKLRSLLTDDRKAALNEIVHGEEHLVKEFDDALNRDVSPELARLLTDCRTEVARKERMIEDLREAS